MACIRHGEQFIPSWKPTFWQGFQDRIRIYIFGGKLNQIETLKSGKDEHSWTFMNIHEHFTLPRLIRLTRLGSVWSSLRYTNVDPSCDGRVLLRSLDLQSWGGETFRRQGLQNGFQSGDQKTVQKTIQKTIQNLDFAKLVEKVLISSGILYLLVICVEKYGTGFWVFQPRRREMFSSDPARPQDTSFGQMVCWGYGRGYGRDNWGITGSLLANHWFDWVI